MPLNSPTSDPSDPVAIIGAGVAGLACANALAQAGIATMLFDKGRGPGGRLSTKRVEVAGQDVRFDHGAQFFTARDPGFLRTIQELIAGGMVAELNASRIGRRTDAGWEHRERCEPVFVGVPGMNGLVKGLAQGHTVAWGQRVLTITPASGGGYTLETDSGPVQQRFSAVAIAVPAEQVAALAGPVAPVLAAEAEASCSAPCWALMAQQTDDTDLPFDAFAVAMDGSPFSWVSREDRRPGRGGPPRWVAHASPAWSKAHLEDNAADVVDALSAALAALTGAGIAPVLAHRWRYSSIEQAAGTPYFWDGGSSIGACGDWRSGPRVELAWLSGTGLGRAIASSR